MTKLFLISALMTLSLSSFAQQQQQPGLGQGGDAVAATIQAEGCNLNVSGTTVDASGGGPSSDTDEGNALGM